MPSLRQIIINGLNEQNNALSALALMLVQRSRRPFRRFNVNPINANRELQGFYQNLVVEMRLNDTEPFFNFHRMSPQLFDELLSIVGPEIQKRYNRSISAGERLSLTLRYLASGDSMVSIGKYGFRIGKASTSYIIRETCQKLWQVMQQRVFPKFSQEFWTNTATDSFNQWNFPHCIGAMDGKHVIVQAFSHSGTIYRNYKNSFSIVLFAVCDANYKFISVVVGPSGHMGDSTVFRNSNFGKALVDGGTNLFIPDPTNLPGSNLKAPYVIVGDEAFPLMPNLMRPYPGRNTSVLPMDKTIYNYRLSRARRVVENAFGILSSRWRIYRRPILASKITVRAIVNATVVLHNWLRDKQGSNYVTHDLVDNEVDGNFRPGRWREHDTTGMENISRIGSNRASQNSNQIRDTFKFYFSNVNTLSWQNYYIYWEASSGEDASIILPLW